MLSHRRKFRVEYNYHRIYSNLLVRERFVRVNCSFLDCALEVRVFSVSHYDELVETEWYHDGENDECEQCSNHTRVGVTSCDRQILRLSIFVDAHELA